MKKKESNYQHSFTPTQVVIVFSITVVSVVVIIFSIDPEMSLRAARNRQRWSEVNTLGRAIYSYREVYDGQLPSGIDADPGTVQILGTDVGKCSRIYCRDKLVNRSQCGVPKFQEDMRSFLYPIPFDPATGSKESTRYYVNVNWRNRLIVGACDEDPEDLEGEADPPTIEVLW